MLPNMVCPVIAHHLMLNSATFERDKYGKTAKRLDLKYQEVTWTVWTTASALEQKVRKRVECHWPVFVEPPCWNCWNCWKSLGSDPIGGSNAAICRAILRATWTLCYLGVHPSGDYIYIYVNTIWNKQVLCFFWISQLVHGLSIHIIHRL